MNKALYKKFIVLLTSRLLQTNSKNHGNNMSYSVAQFLRTAKCLIQN
jgi:hypothetical protein